MGSSTNYTATINVQARIESAVTSIKNLQTELDKLKLSPNLRTSFDTNFKNLYKEIEKYQDIIARGPKTKADSSALERSGNNILKIYNQIIKEINSLDGSTLKNAFKDLGAQEVEKLKVEFENLKKTLGEVIAKSDFGKNLTSSFEDAKKKLGDLNNEATQLVNKLGKTTFKTFSNNLFGGRFDLAENNLKSIQEQINKLDESVQGKQELVEWANNLSAAFEQLKNSGDIKPLIEQINSLKGDISGKTNEFIQQLIQGFEQGKINAEDFANVLQKLINEQNQSARAQVQLNTELSQVKNRITYFLGLSNAINLFKRAVRGAFNTVKELDKAMTETAVVTNYTIKDMWKQLPEYTKRANQLGVTTKAAYESATLYYQQGLNTEQAAALSSETLKMARIAGLEAADATDRMTNALRGFNMELNATQAQRVDDVYSQLAAMSASNVDEISTAMTKVASLAHNANMEFETTAAFLAQIIETTRESAETAGTALKTVVARFSEVKKLYDTEQLKGQDEEGQVIDVNKVSAALRTAGIDLNKYFLGEVGLDDIFMELASKWDSLTNIQQRYIATQAAGSRQQSRFIALMQDQARTQELVSAAYRSSGASEKQFEKTQDSLQSGLARLTNAWNEFLMGLANNQAIKAGVKILTTLLNLVNGLTGAFGDFIGSFLKLGTVIAAIGGLKKLINSKWMENALGKVGNSPLGKFFGWNGQAAGATLETSAAKAGATIQTAADTAGATTTTAATTAGTTATSAASTAGVTTTTAATTAANTLVAGATRAATILAGGSPVGSAAGTAGRVMLGAGGAVKGFLPAGAGASGTTGTASTGTALLGTGVSGAGASASAVLGVAALVIGATVGAMRLSSYLTSGERQIKIAEKNNQAQYEVAKKAKETYDKQKEAYETYVKNEKIIRTSTSAEEREKASVEMERALATLKNIDQNNITVDTNGITLNVKYAEKKNKELENEQIQAETIQNLTEAEVAINKAQYELNKKREVILDNYGGITSQRTKLDPWQEIKYWWNFRKENGWTATESQENIDQYNQGLEDSAREYTEQARNSIISAMSNIFKQGGFNNELIQLMTGAYTNLFDSDYFNKVVQEAGSFEQYVENIRKNIKNKEIYSTQANTLLNLINGNIDNKRLYNVRDEELLKTYGISIDIIDTLSEALGVNADKFKEVAEKQLKVQKEIQKQSVFDTTKRLYSKQNAAQNINKFLKLENFDYQQVIANLAEEFDNLDFGGEIISHILDSMESYNWDNSALQKWINSLNFNNPIDSFDKLSKGINNTDEYIQKISKDILTNYSDINYFSKANQLQYFLTSQSFEDLSDQIDKFKEENDGITSSNVLELADSNKDLNNLLKNNIISVKGLASVLSNIDSINIFNLSNAIISAISATDNLDGAVQQIINDFNNFEPGFDENEITNFISGAYETISKNWEKGAYGNNQIRSYLTKLFGPDIFDFGDISSEEYGKQYQQAVEKYLNILEANKENMYSAWSEVAASGMEGVTEANGEIIIDTMGLTTEQWISKLQQQGYTKEWASAMIADFKNYSADFAYEIAQNDLPKAIEAWADNLGQNINGQKIYDESDVSTLATLLGVTEKDIKDQIEKIKEDLVIVDWGKEAKDIVSVLQDQLGYNIKTEQEGSELIDFNKLKQSMTDAGIPQQFESVLNSMVKTGESFYAQFGDTVKEVTVQTGESAVDAYNRVLDETRVEKLGEAVSEAFKDSDNEVELNLDTASAEEKFAAFLETINTSDPSANVKSNTDSATSTYDSFVTAVQNTPITIPLAASNPTIPGAAKGGKVKSFGKGGIAAGPALTGEEGPEIVWNKEKGYAYITGQNHPEFQNLQPGDEIFDAKKTKKILSSGGPKGIVSSYAKGYGGADIEKEGKGSSDKEKDDEFKMDLDKYYNMVEDINELLRLRNLLEKDYNQLLKTEGKTGKEIYDNLNRQLKLLEERSKIVADLAEKRKQQIIDEVAANQEYQKYAWWNNEDLTIEIDWDLVTSITDKDEGGKVKDYLSKLEDFQSKYDDMIEQLEEIEDTIQDIRERGKDQYNTLEERVRDALIKQIQDKIDELQDVDKAINDTNQKLFDSMQETLSMQRQERDNAKTEEELTDKEKRLAYLQQDSSNANALEIAKLQEELANARQSYTDTLIDQKISELQRQNDEAQEQRAQQIELMQRSLDWQERTVYQYISEGTDAIGALVKQSELERLLMSAEPWDKLSEEQKLNWVNDLMDQVAQGIAYLEMQRQLEDIGTKEGTSISFTNANGQTLTGKADKNGNVVVTNKDGSTITYKDVFQDYHGAYRTFETSGEAKAAPKPAVSTVKPTTTTKPAATTTKSAGTSSGSDNGGSPPDAKDEILRTYYYPVNKTTCMKVDVWKIKGEVQSARGHVEVKQKHKADYITVSCKNCGLLLDAYYDNSNIATTTTVTEVEEEKNKRGYGPNPGGCFVAGTKVIMANYIEKNIEDIKINDYVFAYNECLKIFEPKKVTKSYVHYNTPFIMTLILSNSLIIKMTPGHPILTTTGWKSMDIENSLYEHGVIAKELQINDEIIGYGNNVFIKDIIIKENVDNINVYNIEVEDLHTFIANKIVVHNRKMNAYASGGLNTRTGLAWLDGTTSSPELVLNARDTQNFIELKDVLADMRKGGNFSLNGGDNYYDIKVQVDSLGSDYDVDRAIDRIKARIAQDGAYRNVNTLSRLR